MAINMFYSAQKENDMNINQISNQESIRIGEPCSTTRNRLQKFGWFWFAL